MSSPARKSPPARAKSPAKSSPARSAPAVTKSSSATYQLTLIYLACFLDYFAVALVVPNLVHRWKALGVSPEALGLVQSIYSGSQIVGGLLMGTALVLLTGALLIGHAALVIWMVEVVELTWLGLLAAD